MRSSPAFLALAALATAATPAHATDLIGHWTFEPGFETAELTGNWGAVQLQGATISGGQLHVDSGAWAKSIGTNSLGTIREKTLVSWVQLDDLNVRSGSALSIDNVSGDNFDAIVYAERQTYRWMAGSSYFRRTQDAVSTLESDTSSVHQMAISYEDLGWGSVQITICRDGVQLGQYTSGNMTQWSGTNVEALWGVRHTYSDTNIRGAIDARIEEARIYDGVLSCSELGAVPLWQDSVTDTDGDGVADDDDACPGYDDTLDDDGDLIPDGCDFCYGDDTTGDSDGDLVCDDVDFCDGDDAAGDYDSDGTCDDLDNCVSVANASQTDTDADGVGDACDDDDGDGWLDIEDNCPSTPNAGQSDTDGDGEGDACDADDDGDGVDDGSDNCPLLANADQADTDADGEGDACDADDDADGVLDDDDLCAATPLDALTDDSGCSGEQRVDLTCGDCDDYRNHGQYVSCVTRAANQARRDGLITNREKSALTQAAAHSSVGH